MKVLFLMSFPVNGIEDYVKGGGIYHGHNLYGYSILKSEGIEVDWIPNTIKGFWNKTTVRRRLYSQFLCLKKANKYDIIFSPHDIHILPIAILRYFKIIRTPIIMVCHFSYNMKYVSKLPNKILKKIERFWVYRAIDKIVFANDVLMNLAIEDYPVPEKHRQCVYWGASIAFFDSYKLKIARNPKNTYFSAMGNANRDYKTLVSAFSELPYELKIFAKASPDLELQSKPLDNVKFYDFSHYGYSGMAVLREYYYDAIAILLPIKYLNDVPNGATVLLEALAAGKPIVITDCDTNYIDVEKEGVGIKVLREDVEGWKEAIMFLVNNPEIAYQMGKNAYNLAVKKYNLQSFTDKVYQEMKLLNNK